MEESITRMLVSHFSQVLVLKDDYVYRQGDEGTDMYFVFTGILAVLSPIALSKKSDYRGKSRASASRVGSTIQIDVKSLKQLSELASGDFFGENALFSDNPRNAYVRARTSCILYSLSRHSLEMVFELYPNWKKRVLQTVKIQQKQQRLNAPTNDRQQQKENLSSTSSVREDASAEDDEEVSHDQPEEITAISRENPRPIAVTQGWQRLLPRYVAVIDPYRIAFDSCERWTGIPIAINLIEILCTLLFPLDIWVNWRLKESEISIEIYEEKHRDSYKAERLMWDVVAALPIDYVLSFAFAEALRIRLFRCIKVKNIVHYMNEIDRQSVSYEWARFKTIWVLYILVIYWSACAYLKLSSHEGYGTVWNAWLPTEDTHTTNPANPSPSQLWLRFFRAMFFAVTTFVKKCHTFVPESTLTSVFSILICFVGLLVMSFMIGEISSLYISYIGNEVKFRKDQIEAELYLSRWKIGREMKTRVHLFLSTLWSSRRGINYQHVFDELPRKIRRQTVLHIAELPIKALTTKAFRPLAHGDALGLKILTSAIADQLRFESYPRGESVVVEGTIPKGMYFVVKGTLTPTSEMHPELCRAVCYKKGSYFSEQGLLGYSVSKISVRTMKASDLLSLSTDGLLSALQSHSFFSIALNLVKKLFNDLREMHSGEIPKSRDVWASHLKKILVRQRMEWALSLTSSPSHANASAEVESLDMISPPYLPFTPSLPVSGATTGSTLPKGATLWSAVLAGVLGTDTPYTCLQMFEASLELVVSVGELYDKTTMTTAVSLRGTSANDAALPRGGASGGGSELRLKTVVQQIGTSRLRMKGVAQKLSHQLGQSTQSQRNLNVINVN